MVALFGLLAAVIVIAPVVSLVLTLQMRGRLRALQEEVERLRAREGPEAGARRPLSTPPDQPSAEPGLAEAPASSGVAQPAELLATPGAARSVEAPASSDVVEPAGIPAPPGTEAPRPTPSAAAREGGLESFVGGRVLLVVGVVAVLLALGFFFKLAIDRGWITEPLRVAVGVLAGMVALVGGDRLRARGYDAYGHAIMGAGLGALFLCTFVSALRYELIARGTAFALCGGVTALGVGLAVWRRAPLLAWLGFLGGFVAPALLGREDDALGSLVAWLVLLDLGVAGVLVFRPWRGLDAFAAVASLVSYAVWHERWYEVEHLSRATTALAVLQGAVLVLTLVPAWVGKRALHAESMVVLVLGTLAAFLAAHELLWPDGRVALGLACLAVAVIAQLAARGQESRHGASSPDAAVLDAQALAGLAVCLGLALRDEGLVWAWCATGLIFLQIGVRFRRVVQAAGGVLMLAAGGATVLEAGLPLHAGEFLPFLNVDTLTAAVPCVAFVLAGWLVDRGVPSSPSLPGDASVAPSSASAPLASPASPGSPTTLASIILLWGPQLLRAVGLWAGAALVAVEVHESVMAGAEAVRPALRLALGRVTIALGVYAVVVAWIWGRRPPAPGVLATMPLGAAIMMSLLLLDVTHAPGFTPVLNELFGAGFAVVLAGVGVAVSCPGPMRRAALVAAGLLLLVFATREIWAWGQLTELDGITREQALFRAHVTISTVWAVYGVLLLTAGFRRRVAEVRWAGLAMLLVTVGKVFLFDLSSLDTIYRIGSFLVLGVLLVAMAFFYQRRFAGADGG